MAHHSKVLLIADPSVQRRYQAEFSQARHDVYVPENDIVAAVAETRPDIVALGRTRSLQDWFSVVRASLCLPRIPVFHFLDSIPAGFDDEIKQSSLGQAWSRRAPREDGGSLWAPQAADLLHADPMEWLLLDEWVEHSLTPYVRRCTQHLGHREALLVFREPHSARWSLIHGGAATVLDTQAPFETVPPMLSRSQFGALVPKELGRLIRTSTDVVPVIQLGSKLIWLLLPPERSWIGSPQLRALHTVARAIIARPDRTESTSAIATAPARHQQFGIAVDSHGEILEVADALAIRLGYLEQDLVGTPLTRLLDPASRADIARALVVPATATQGPLQLQLALRGSDATDHYYDATMQWEMDRHSWFLALVPQRLGAAQPVDAQARLAILTQVFESSSDPIIAADRKGHVVLYNPTAEKYLGWAADAVSQQKFHVTQLYPDGVARQIFRKLNEDLLRGGPGRIVDYECSILHKNGRRIPVAMTAALLFDDAHKITGSVGIFRDISALRKAQAQSALYASDTLQQAQDRVVRGLAGATAHRVNQPLQALHSSLGLLQRALSKVTLPDDIGSVVQRNVQRALEQAQDIADEVAKIAKIQHFETTGYAESTEIIDVEQSIDRDPGPRRSDP